MKKELALVEERKLAIVGHLKAHKKATVSQFCEMFGVSSATIRNDLRDLEDNRLITRTDGVARKPSGNFSRCFSPTPVQ